MSHSTTPEIPEDLRPALVGLARGRTAALRLDRVADAIRMPDCEAAVILAALQGLDLVTIWERGPAGRPHVVLTPRAVALLGLELADRRNGGFSAYWVAAGKGEDPGPRPSVALSETDASADPDRSGLLDLMPDPRAIDLAEAAAEDDWMADPVRRKTAMRGVITGLLNPPRPTLILGVGVQWPTPRKPGEPCPVCHGLPLGRLVYCCAEGCDRSGLDAMLPVVSAYERPRHDRPKSTAGATLKGRPKPVGLGGGKGPAGAAKDLPIPERKKPGKKRKKAAGGPTRNSFDLNAL